MSKTIYTGQFWNIRGRKDLTGFSIARGQPDGFDLPELDQLRPEWGLLNSADEEPMRFTRIYLNKYLDPLDENALWNRLPDGAVLCCWEAPENWCHRRLVAEYLEDTLSVVIPEVTLSRDECYDYYDRVTSLAYGGPPPGEEEQQEEEPDDEPEEDPEPEAVQEDMFGGGGYIDPEHKNGPLL